MGRRSRHRRVPAPTKTRRGLLDLGAYGGIGDGVTHSVEKRCPSTRHETGRRPEGPGSRTWTRIQLWSGRRRYCRLLRRDFRPWIRDRPSRHASRCPCCAVSHKGCAVARSLTKTVSVIAPNLCNYAHSLLLQLLKLASGGPTGAQLWRVGCEALRYKSIMPDQPHADPQDSKFGREAAEKEVVLDEALSGDDRS